MSLAYDTDASQEYATRTQLHYLLRVSMAKIAIAIRDGKLELHLIDGKIQISVAEARKVFGRTNGDLFG
jgi:transcriptional antiterminator